MEKSDCGKDFRRRQRICCWADFIFVMEKRHAERLRGKFPESFVHKKIICLDIPDHLTYMHPELIELLKDRLSEYIELS